MIELSVKQQFLVCFFIMIIYISLTNYPHKETILYDLIIVIFYQENYWLCTILNANYMSIKVNCLFTEIIGERDLNNDNKQINKELFN